MTQALSLACMMDAVLLLSLSLLYLSPSSQKKLSLSLKRMKEFVSQSLLNLKPQVDLLKSMRTAFFAVLSNTKKMTTLNRQSRRKLQLAPIPADLTCTKCVSIIKI
jgi:hypothetical protein